MKDIKSKIQNVFQMMGTCIKDFFISKDTGRLTNKGKGFLCLVLFLFMMAVLIALIITSRGKHNPDGKTLENKENALQETAFSENGEIIEIVPYDKDADIIDIEKFDGTILPETEDAGEEYINETLFLGDSNSVRYMNYKFTTLDNTLAVVGMGIQSVDSMKCVKFDGMTDMVNMVDAVKIMQPRRIIINFGTNNATGMSTEDFIKKYSDVLDKIHNAYEYADIIVGAIPPFAKDTQYKSISMTSIDSFNAALVNLAEEKGYKFLNSSEVMKDEKTGYIKAGFTVNDGIHISEAGLKTLFNYIRTHAYISTDSRPKPLKPIPKHTETVAVVKSNGEVNTDMSAAMDMSDIGITDVPVDNGIKDLDKLINSGTNNNASFDSGSQNSSSSDTGSLERQNNENVEPQSQQVHQHSFGGWYNDGGSHSRTCACGEKESQGHSFNGGSVTTPATETTDGVKTYTCTVCGAVKTEKIPATGSKEPSVQPPKVDPAPAPAPEPTPEPVPEPAPEPTPEPAPEPQPQPEPTPEEPQPEPSETPKTDENKDSQPEKENDKPAESTAEAAPEA